MFSARTLIFNGIAQIYKVDNESQIILDTLVVIVMRRRYGELKPRNFADKSLL